MIPRETVIEQSVQDYVREILFTRWSYPADEVELLDSFPTGRFEKALDKNYVAVGYNFDDGGEQGECGSDLKKRLYTIEFFIFGTTALWGRNLSGAVKAALEQDASIPLKDIGTSDAVIDQLVVVPRGLSSRQVPIRDPRPWERFVWLTTVKLEDFYFAALAV